MSEKANNFFSRIINFFKNILKKKDISLIPESTADVSETISKGSNFKQAIEIEYSHADLNVISEKNITMFLYKQVRLGKLDPKYIPDPYLQKIKILLKEEKKIKQNEITRINAEIAKDEQEIRRYNKKH